MTVPASPSLLHTVRFTVLRVSAAARETHLTLAGRVVPDPGRPRPPYREPEPYLSQLLNQAPETVMAQPGLLAMRVSALRRGPLTLPLPVFTADHFRAVDTVQMATFLCDLTPEDPRGASACWQLDFTTRQQQTPLTLVLAPVML